MALEFGFQSQVESYQRLKNGYLITPSLTLSIIRYGSRVKWCNEYRPPLHHSVVANKKGAFGSPSTTAIANFTTYIVLILNNKNVGPAGKYVAERCDCKQRT